MKKKLTKNIDILRLNLDSACEEFNRTKNMWGLDSEGNLWWYGHNNPLILLSQIEQIKQEIKELEETKNDDANK